MKKWLAVIVVVGAAGAGLIYWQGQGEAEYDVLDYSEVAAFGESQNLSVPVT